MMPELLLILIVVMAIAGVKLLLFGLRGRRIDDHPTCRVCQFDLIGSWPSSTICPECGADLTVADAVQIGQHRRRRISLGAGVAMLLLAAVVLWFVTFQVNPGLNWSVLKTDSWLVHDLRSTKVERVETALAELVRRDRRGSLSNKNRSALLDHIYINLIPQLQTTEVEWSPVVEQAWIDGTLSKDRILEYVQPALGMSFYVKEQQAIHKGDILRFGFSLQPPFGHREHAMELEIHPMSSGVGDFVYQLNPRAIQFSIHPELNTADGGVLWDTPVEVEPGNSTLHLTWSVRIAIAGHPETALTWRDSLDQPINVLPPGPDSFTFFKDAQTANQIRDAIHFDVVGVRQISEKDIRTVIVGKVWTDRLDVHASVSIDLTDNNGVIEGTYLPQNIGWGSWQTFHVFVPKGQENESLEFALFAIKEYGTWTSSGHEPVSDQRPLWFGSPVTFRVPVRWVDGPESEGVSDDIRRTLERDARGWRRDDER